MISILCPTRHRPVKLLRLVKSIVETADRPDSYEVVLRMHADDAPTIALIPELLPLGPVTIIVGQPYTEWMGHVTCFTEAARLARGDWFWVMNDDCVVEGKGWDRLVETAPLHSFNIPEIHRLGGSTYHNDMGLPMCIGYRGLWHDGSDELRFPGDHVILDRVKERGFNIHFLPGIGVWHDRIGHD